MIEREVQLHRAFRAAKHSPGKHLRAQVDDGRIETEQLVLDGKRVAVVTPVESAEAPKQEHQVVFLQNSFDELRRRVPLGK